MGRLGGFVEFKPARRVFAGRGRSLMTFGEWKIAFFGMAFGIAVGSAWFIEYPTGEAPEKPVAALAQPIDGEKASPVPVETPDATEEIADEPGAPDAEPDRVLPQIILAQNDGRMGRAGVDGDFRGRVSRVVDGDTFYLEGVETRIRLWGVDAPERSEHGYDEATEALAGLVSGEALSCEHVDTDPYKRIVARCYFNDGRDLSEAMIKSGAAQEYLRFSGGYYGGE